MCSLSIGAAGRSPASAATRSSRPEPAGTNSSPGLVQNWPFPSDMEPTKPVGHLIGPLRPASGVTKAGFTLPSSP